MNQRERRSHLANNYGPKVCGKLLTHHRRGYGVDVEALRDRFPLRQITGKGPKWDLMGTEGCSGGKVVSWLPLMFLGNKSICRRKKYVGGATWGPRGWGRTLLPRGYIVEFQTSTPSLLVCFWSKKDHHEGFILFGIPFSRNTEIGKKHKVALGLWLIG